MENARARISAARGRSGSALVIIGTCLPSRIRGATRERPAAGVVAGVVGNDPFGVCCN